MSISRLFLLHILDKMLSYYFEILLGQNEMLDIALMTQARYGPNVDLDIFSQKLLAQGDENY